MTVEDATFLNLQSGNARPHIYVEAIVSGVTSVLADSFTSTNFLIDGGTIDREKPALPGDRSSIFSSDVTLKLDNTTKRFSPKDSASVFFDNDYLNSQVNYWAGFVNVSGTAMLLQRGAFSLDTLRIDSRQHQALLRVRDKFNNALDIQIGGADQDGTATQFVASGVVDGSDVIGQLLITGAGLTAGDLSLQTAGISFNSISFSQQSVAQAISLVAEASDGYVYTSRRGIVTFASNAPVQGTATATFTLRGTTLLENAMYEESHVDRLSKVIVNFMSGTSVSVISEGPGNTATTLIIDNDALQSRPEAQAIASRTRDRFSGVATKLEMQSVWLPSLDIDDRVTVFLSAVGLSGHNFRIHKIQEEPTNGTMTIFAITERGTKSLTDNKFAFFSDPSAVNPSGGAFTGGASELNGWQAHWGFFVVDNVTGFDDDGDNDNTLDTSVSASGAGGTGIEVPFLFY